jgi:hypothetical protein
MYPAQRRSIVRPIVHVLAVAGAGFVAGALFHNLVSSRDVSAAFATPARAAESNFRDALPAIGTAPSADTVDWDRSDREQISEPRECDVAEGITTACLFMD